VRLLSDVDAIMCRRILSQNFASTSVFSPLRKDITDKPLLERIICLLDQFVLILDRIMCIFEHIISKETD